MSFVLEVKKFQNSSQIIFSSASKLLAIIYGFMQQHPARNRPLKLEQLERLPHDYSYYWPGRFEFQVHTIDLGWGAVSDLSLISDLS